ncbi:MAG: PIN domain-containing protein [Dehalococcoidia bacterium]|nr:PIN domain-containing protein [Dehalococcoidia bacterium]
MSDSIVVDTSAFIAAFSSDDTFHPKAWPLYADITKGKLDLYTTSYIVVECSSLIHRRKGFTYAKDFIESIQPIFNIFWIDQSIHWEAWKSMVEKKGIGLNLVDWTTAIVANQLGASVFTFDKDFYNEGLSVIPRQIGT